MDVPAGKASLFARSKIWQNAAGSEELANSVDASATGCALSGGAVVPSEGDQHRKIGF
jgi:hypothetical protein